MRKAISGILLIFLLTLVTGGIAACAPELTTPPPGVCEKVDPTFRQFCYSIGPEIMGDLQSDPMVIDGQLCQYTTNFLMCYDRSGKLPRVELSSLSTRWNFAPEVGYASDDHNSCKLLDRFESLDARLSKVADTGHLWTCPNYNYGTGKITQFKENVAYSVDMYDTEAEAQMWPLGQMLCQQYGDCRLVHDAIAMPVPQTAIPCRERFERVSLGELTGLLAAGPFTTEACNTEVIFAGVAFCMSDDCASFKALPLGTKHGTTTLPVVKNEQLSYQTRFIEIRNGMGYHVPKEIDFFISLHGGYEISGMPISEAFPLEGVPDVLRQCFENFCLDYNGTLPRGQNMKLVPLGDIEASILPPGAVLRPVFSRYNVNIQVGEKQPYIAKGERQVISLLVFNSQAEAIDGLKFKLTLKAPNGRLIGIYEMPVTDQEGKSIIDLDPIESEKGDIIEYSVCVDLPTAYPICKSDTFVIWY